MRLHLLLRAPLPGIEWGMISSSCQNIRGACPSWAPSMEGVGAALLEAGVPPPAQRGYGCEALGATDLQPRAEHHPEAESGAKWQPQKGARSWGVRAWRQEGERLRGRFVHAFGLVQTRMGGSLLNPRFSRPVRCSSSQSFTRALCSLGPWWVGACPGPRTLQDLGNEEATQPLCPLDVERVRGWVADLGAGPRGGRKPRWAGRRGVASAAHVQGPRV